MRMERLHFRGHVVPANQAHSPFGKHASLDGLAQQNSETTMTLVCTDAPHDLINSLFTPFQHLREVPITLRKHARQIKASVANLGSRQN